MNRKKPPFTSSYNVRNHEKNFIIEQAVKIVCAYIQGNPRIKVDYLQDIIISLIELMYDINLNFSHMISQTVSPVAIEDSRQPDYIVCLEDGTHHKVLKRYLAKHFDMTPEEYIAKWNLPDNYKLTSLNHEKERREATKRLQAEGKMLGRKIVES